MSRWTNAKTPKSCNTFPAVWAAIVGCTGKGTAWRYTIGHFGRRTPEYACPTCQAAQDASEALRGPAHTAHLEALREAAGVADYRVAEVAWIDGRPQLTGKVDVSLAYEAADYALRGLTTGEDARHAAHAIRVYCEAGGTGARALVASHRLSPRQRAALAAAYRAAAA